MSLSRIPALFLPLVLIAACQTENRQPPTAADGPPLFELLPPEQTGLTFQNTLEEGLNTNILMYEYFYNGGGVAVGDFNGDGYQDLYFTSNMGENKLYVHKGKPQTLEYTDATAVSGAAGRPGPWKTGVNVADVNGDGKLDIYLCYSGAMPEEKRKNQLFINLGNGDDNLPRFEDRAEACGLASGAFSNQAYFFDYDRDGDLDLLLLNHNPKNLPILNENKTAAILQTDDPLRGVRLFAQDQGRFTDKTQAAGISSSELTYGLGIGLSDLNDDGWPDFYISNDYAVPDYLYLNNRNGTFRNALAESIGHTSQFSMGNDVADLNNDGRPDIVTLDMLPEDNERQKLLLAPDNYAKFDLNVRSGFYYQYMRNMLHLNNGNGTFSEIGQYAGLSNTDWSWSALAADYDNDGWKDLYVTNGYFRDYTNLDFVHYLDEFLKQKGRLIREDVLEIVAKMPASNVRNYLFRGDSTLVFKNRAANWGTDQPANSNGAAYADLDNDGDLDLVVNNINKPAFVYRNQSDAAANHFLQVQLKGAGLNTLGIGAKVRLFAGARQFLAEQFPARGYLSAVTPVLHFGLGRLDRLDSLVVEWPGGKQEKRYQVAVNSTLTFDEKDAQVVKPARHPRPAPVFSPAPAPLAYTQPALPARDFDRQKLLLSQFSAQGPCLVKGDLNGDGLDDLFIGGSGGQGAAVYLQSKSGALTRAANPAFEQDKQCEDSDAVLLDANGDGAADLFVVSGGYHQFSAGDPRLQDRLYLNDGRGRFTKSADALPNLTGSGSCAVSADFNRDGHPDLFVGGRVVPGRYPEPPASSLLFNDGSGKFTDRTATFAPELATLGMVCDAVATDLNQDQWPDLVVAGECLPVTALVNENGKFKNETAAWFGKAWSGFWNRIEAADLNGDRRPDFIVGNLGANTQIRASEEQPADLYFADFDRNGSVDPVFCFYIQGKSYPYLTRDELLSQLGIFRSRYTSYKSYATVTVQDIFTKDELARAGHLSVNRLETTLFLSDAGGRYAPHPLPAEAQYAPVHTISVLDYDKDGRQDLLLCGNNKDLKLRLGKVDANYGVLLRGNGNGTFNYVEQLVSGLSLKGDVRNVVQLGDLFLFGINQGPLAAYRLNPGK